MAVSDCSDAAQGLACASLLACAYVIFTGPARVQGKIPRAINELRGECNYHDFEIWPFSPGFGRFGRLLH